MHVVIEPLCTGCELCVPACPVDCIVVRPAILGESFSP
jgi:electron transport complex protein RnfB